MVRAPQDLERARAQREGIDLPGQYEAMRRFEYEHLAIFAHRAVDADLVPAPAHARLEYMLLGRDLQDRVRCRPPARHARGKDFECAGSVRLDVNALAHGRDGDRAAHFSSFLSAALSTSAWN